jgi:SAM-dependent methyltransferase
MPAGEPRDRNDGRLRTGTVVVHGRRVHAVRSFRRLQAESEQHVHDAASRLAPIAGLSATATASQDGALTGSISFDRAATYYDRTRSLRPETHRAVIELLSRELAGREACLEIGVGTGRLALDLLEAGTRMAGADLSLLMLQKLVDNAGGLSPFPLVQADATALPFPDAAFGAGLACHVFHLIPAWAAAVRELVRVVAPDGVLLVDLGGPGEALNGSIRDHFCTAAGVRRPRPGLDDEAKLDRLLEELGLTVRALEPLVERRTVTIEQMISRLESGLFSVTWSMTDEDRRSAADATRHWAEREHGSLGAEHAVETLIRWRAYDLPAARRTLGS